MRLRVSCAAFLGWQLKRAGSPVNELFFFANAVWGIMNGMYVLCSMNLLAQDFGMGICLAGNYSYRAG